MLRDLEHAHPDRLVGLYGPGTVTWQLAKESVVFVGGGCAALLQAAHPFVAQAVHDHSTTKTDLPGRFQRTFLNVFEMVFGDLDAAVKSAKRVHNIHSHISGTLPESVGRFPAGTLYEANDEESLLWVHATLIHTAVRVTELILGPLDPAIKDTYWRESHRFAHLFGIPDDLLPATWVDFDHYVRRMWDSDTLGVGAAAADICHFLLEPPRPLVAPAWRWYRTMTGGLLPERLRAEFGFTWGTRQRTLFDASLRALRAVYPRVPRGLRYLPAYVDARRRLQGKSGRALYGQLVERAILAGLQNPLVPTGT